MRHQGIALFVVAIALTPLCARGQAAAEIEALKKKRADVEAKYNLVYAQYRDARNEILQSDEMVEATQHLNDARQAREKKVQSSTRITAAYKAYEEASTALNQLVDAEAKADAEGAAIMQEIQKLDDQADEVESQQRLANFMLSELKRRAHRIPEVRTAYRAYEQAENAVYAAMRNDPDIAAAAKTLEEARQIPLGRADIENAQRAYDERVKNSPSVAQATAARDSAKKAYESALEAKVSANPQSAELKKKIADCEAKLKETATAKSAAGNRFDAVRQRVSKSSAKVAQSRQAYSASYQAYTQAVAQEVPNESAAVEELQRIYYEKLEEKTTADPRAAALRKEVEDLNREMEAVSGQIRKLEAPKG